MWRWPLTGRVSVSTSITCWRLPTAIEELERWCRSLGEIHAFGIEGTGFLRRRGSPLPDRSRVIPSLRSIDLTGQRSISEG